MREVFERFLGVTEPVITLPDMTISDSDTPGVTSVLRVLPQILLDFQFFDDYGILLGIALAVVAMLLAWYWDVAHDLS